MYIVSVQKTSDESNLCVICHKKIDGYGNWAEPIAKGFCCDSCNKKVLAARLKQLGKMMIDAEKKSKKGSK